MDYETNGAGHLTSAHLTTDAGRLSITLAPAGVVITVNGISIHVEREDIGGIIDVLSDFIVGLEAALEEVQ